MNHLREKETNILDDFVLKHKRTIRVNFSENYNVKFKK